MESVVHRVLATRPSSRYESPAWIVESQVSMAMVLALVTIGYWHFENIRMGVGAAALYLMLPYTAQMTGHVDHVLPAALLLWAVVLYRRPALAGILIGLALSVFYYPLFLLPLWISFYWQRGLARFLSGVGGSVLIGAGVTMELRGLGPVESSKRLVQLVSERFD